jgi:hypothetical protein
VKSVICSVAIVVTATVVHAQCPVPPANTPSAAANSLAISRLSQFLKCEEGDPLNDQSPCNTFASRGLEAIYGVTDFRSGTKSHQSANQMWDTVNSPGTKWTQLGTVFNEANNLCAQSAANAGWPVIALLKAAGHGHVALVIPGQPTVSNSWGMLTANSASFFLDKPTSVYLNKGLSSAFGPTNAQKAVFFYRKPS